MCWLILVSALLILLIQSSLSLVETKVRESENGTPNCSTLLSESLLKEIRSYKSDVMQIIQAITKDHFKGQAYADLEFFVDKFGSRLTGSEALEKSIDFMLEKMGKLGLENVHPENVTAPKWVRGEESLRMMRPYSKVIPVLGLALSIQTPEDGITAQIVVVDSFHELFQSVKNASGKILVFNHPFEDPEKAIKYRQLGAIEGAKLGAVAVILRSYATFSLGTPHTGLMFYDSNVTHIPAAEISIEDAKLLSRLYNKGENVTLHLKLRNEEKGEIISRNSIGDSKGTTTPDEYVLISGHMDSWDVGQGALDDGYGVVLSVKVHEVLKALNLSTRRTIRTILWTAEEVGEVPFGAAQYVEAHLPELGKYTIFLEADSGILEAHGLIFNGSHAAACIMDQVLKLLEPELIKNTKVYRSFPRLKTDIVTLMGAVDVPGALIATNADKYFWYHHSQADTMEAIDPHDLDICLAMWSALAHVLGNLSVLLPR